MMIFSQQGAFFSNRVEFGLRVNNVLMQQTEKKHPVYDSKVYNHQTLHNGSMDCFSEALDAF